MRLVASVVDAEACLRVEEVQRARVHRRLHLVALADPGARREAADHDRVGRVCSRPALVAAVARELARLVCLGRARVDVTVLPAGDRASLQVEFRREDERWVVSRADLIRD